jgi:phage host-nuclease inhibitor protein Gam
MDINELLNQIAQSVKEDLEESEEESSRIRKDIGVVGEDLIKAFEDLEERKRELEDKIEMNVRRIERLLARESREMKKEVKLTNDQLWQQVYKELNIEDQDKTYSINRLTGVVSLEIKAPSVFENVKKDLL